MSRSNSVSSNKGRSVAEEMAIWMTLSRKALTNPALCIPPRVRVGQKVRDSRLRQMVNKTIRTRLLTPDGCLAVDFRLIGQIGARRFGTLLTAAYRTKERVAEFDCDPGKGKDCSVQSKAALRVRSSCAGP